MTSEEMEAQIQEELAKPFPVGAVVTALLFVLGCYSILAGVFLIGTSLQQPAETVLVGGYNQMGEDGFQLIVLGAILAYVTVRDARKK